MPCCTARPNRPAPHRNGCSAAASTNQICNDLRNSFEYVSFLQTLNQPRVCRVEPHQQKMISLNLFAQRDLLHAHPQLFHSRGNRCILLRQLDPATRLGGRTISISCAYHLFPSLLPREFCMLLARLIYSARYAFNKSSSSASFTGFVR